MLNATLSRLVVGLLLFVSGGLLAASEAEALRERAQAIRKEASILGARGDREGAKRLERESNELLAAAEKMTKKDKNPEKEFSEVREQPAGVARDPHTLRPDRARHGELPPELHARMEMLEGESRRIHHFTVAAENLKIAGAHDLAHEVMKKAESMEREIQEGKNRLEIEIQRFRGRAPQADHGPMVFMELREEIEQLRAEIKELRAILVKKQ